MSNEVGLMQDADLKEQIRIELESTRQKFHLLLEEIPVKVVDQPSLNPAWTIREFNS